VSDDLVKRLRFRWDRGMTVEAADHIEELEAQLKTMIDPQVAENMVRVAEPMLSDALAAADKRIEELEKAVSDDLDEPDTRDATPEEETMLGTIMAQKNCIDELEKALANMQREYDKRGGRIEKLEAANKLLNEQLDSIEEHGNEALNALPDCLMRLAPALVENDELKAKLRMAVETLGIAAEWLDDYSAFTGNTYETTKSKTVRVAIAKIKGEQL
jgi:chromosome segregation ATPase